MGVMDILMAVDAAHALEVRLLGSLLEEVYALVLRRQRKRFGGMVVVAAPAGVLADGARRLIVKDNVHRYEQGQDAADEDTIPTLAPCAC
jgi:hypothetical protein